MELANYLYSLVYSDTYGEDEWEIWAENLLKNAEYEYDDNTEWVYNVCLAAEKQQLFDAIYEKMNFGNYYNGYCLTEIIQGYYYDQYQNKKISLYDMLEKSGDAADAGQDSSTTCEFFYDLCNKIDNDSSIVDSADFLECISEYYEPLYVAAMEQKRKLEAATIEDIKLDL